jgi:hypothetical protein
MELRIRPQERLEVDVCERGEERTAGGPSGNTRGDPMGMRRADTEIHRLSIPLRLPLVEGRA